MQSMGLIHETLAECLIEHFVITICYNINLALHLEKVRLMKREKRKNITMAQNKQDNPLTINK